MSVFSDDGILLVKEEKARRNAQEALTFLENDFHSLASLLEGYYPLSVLSKAAWQGYELSLGRKDDEFGQALSRFLPVLIQSVYQSKYFKTDYGFSSRTEIKEKDWKRILSLANDAARRLIRLIDSHAVVQVKSGAISQDLFDTYRHILFTHVFPLGVTKEQLEKSRNLYLTLFCGDEETIETLFPKDSGNLLEELYKVAGHGAFAMDELTASTRDLHSEIAAKARTRAANTGEDYKTCFKDILTNEGYQEKIKEMNDLASSPLFFSAEANSLLSSEACRLFSAAASSVDKVIEDGFFVATTHPFVKFADRYYSFVNSTFLISSLHALRRIMQENNCMKTGKMDRLCNTLIESIFRGSDGDDVYSFRGYRFDIIPLTSLYYVNAYKYPEIFQRFALRRKEELERRPQPGHILLFIDPDSFADLQKLDENRFIISLAAFANAAKAGDGGAALCQQLIPTMTEREKDEEVEDLTFYADDDEKWEDVSQFPSDLQADEINPILEDEESEFDETDDDVKAKILEERYENEGELPDDTKTVEDGSQKLKQLAEEYELPDKLKNEAITQEYDALEADDFLPPDEGPKPDLEEDDEVEDFFLDEEDEAEDEENGYLFDFEDEGYDDPEIKEEEEVLDEDEWDDSCESGDCYAPLQLSLFDEEGNPHEEDELVSLDSIDDDTSELRRLDEEPTPLFPQISLASEAEEADDFDRESSLQSAFTAYDDSVERHDESKAEAEEALIVEEKIKEREVSCESLEKTSQLSQADAINEDEPVYGSEGEFQHLEIDIDLPQRIKAIVSLLSSHLPPFYNLITSGQQTVDNLDAALGKAILSSQEEGRDKLINIAGCSLTLLVTHNSRLDSFRKMEIKLDTGALMVKHKKDEWSTLLLSYSEENSLFLVYSETVNKESFSQTDWKIVRSKAGGLR